MSDDFLRALIDPTAPLPHDWPGGILGIFLLFCMPIGGGIPLGVIMARNAGLSPLDTAGLYLGSDVVLALTTEPMLAGLRWLSQRVPLLARIGQVFARFTGGVGLRDDGVQGPLGLILVAFSISPTTGRAAAAAAGHGFFSGWSLAIIGDMLYFGVLMATTLWVSSIFGDDRNTIGAVLLGTWLVPVVIRRLRRRGKPARSAAAQPEPRLSPALAPALAGSTSVGAEAAAAPASRRAATGASPRRARAHGSRSTRPRRR